MPTTPANDGHNDAPNEAHNDGQARFWNTGSGKNWVRYQAGLDACFDNINQQLLNRCKFKLGDHVLDVGCGTGATSIQCVRIAGGSVNITGIDISAPLLEHGRKRIALEGLSNIKLVEADVQTHKFIDNSFDWMISRFGVMFFGDPVVAFRNIARAIKPGGQIAFSAWAELKHNPWFKLPRDAAVERLGKPDPVNPNEPGPLAFSDINYVKEIFEGAGLSDYSISESDSSISTTLCREDMSELACNLGPAVRLVKEKKGTDADTAAIKQAVATGFDQYYSDSGFNIPVRLVNCQVVIKN